MVQPFEELDEGSPSRKSVCPDCPASRQDVLEELVRGPHACQLRCQTVAARSPIPTRWFAAYAAGLVRRGIVVRQRVDAQGRVTAVDAAGAGSLVVFASPADWPSASAPSGYAATDLLVCLCPREVLDGSVRSDPAVGKDLFHLQQQAFDRVERIADARNRATVDSRVAALLCTLSDTLSPTRKRDRVPPGIQQRDMAQLLSLRHETVCRSIGALEKRGAIRRGPEGLTISDRPLLESL